ncbi:MAG: helix-turn-helix domain-containing protein, partial [Clostridiales bacterium]|nr:helix-turn-helix domain-containing protein [Clostridiales bacterium]
MAKYVHVSNSYLSHMIKDAMGLSFEKLLNQIRAEHSMKFLLTSDKSITKISQECGFSDPKYFKSYFSQFFRCTPEEYRESNQHKVAAEDFEAVSYFETIVFNDLLVNKINQYLDEPVKDLDESVVDITVDFNNRKERTEIKKEWKKEIIMSATDYPKTIRYMEKIKILQDEIGFEYIYIKDMASSSFFEYLPEGTIRIDWNELDHLMELIIGMKAYPKLGFDHENLEDEVFIEILQKFLFHYKLKYSEAEIQNWILVFHQRSDCNKSKNEFAMEDVVYAISKQIRLETTADGLQIQIVDDQKRPMFDSGSAAVK